MQVSTAVLVIDVQLGLFTRPKRPVENATEILANINLLAGGASPAGIPIVVIQDNDVAEIGSLDWELHPKLNLGKLAHKVRKPFGDSFYKTDLHDWLQAKDVTRLVVCGCMTDACVDVTVRRALALGYDIVLAANAHGTAHNSFMTAERTVEYYNLVWDGLGLEDGFGCGVRQIQVLPVSEISLAFSTVSA